MVARFRALTPDDSTEVAAVLAQAHVALERMRLRAGARSLLGLVGRLALPGAVPADDPDRDLAIVCSRLEAVLVWVGCKTERRPAEALGLRLEQLLGDLRVALQRADCDKF